MKRKISVVLILSVVSFLFIYAGDYKDYYKKPVKKGVQINQSNYNYVPLAKGITAGCKSRYDKIKAIYQWICKNISFDTDYRIHTADECIDKKKGVCQAYCELFYQLAKAVGVKVEIVQGISKNYHGMIGSSGHGWLFAYTRRNHGFLLDPTWGAGSVKGNSFIQNKNIWIWFDTNPEWIILSHHPDNYTYQLIDKPISRDEFKALPPVDDIWVEYGLNIHDIYQKACSHALSLPTFYTRGEGIIELLDIPLCPTLEIGKHYLFRIKMNTEDDFAIISDNTICPKEEWKYEGNNIYSVNYMPRDMASLKLCVWNNAHHSWNIIVNYEMEEPNASNWNQVEALYPLSSPRMKAVKNLESEVWNEYGIDNHQLLKLIKEQDVYELPDIYNSQGQRFSIVSVPMNKQLKEGSTYTFSFYPKSGIHWVLVNNHDWHTNWSVEDDGKYSMEISPSAGSLTLYVQFSEGASYWSCLAYEVK